MEIIGTIPKPFKGPQIRNPNNPNNPKPFQVAAPAVSLALLPQTPWLRDQKPAMPGSLLEVPFKGLSKGSVGFWAPFEGFPFKGFRVLDFGFRV